MLALKGSQPAGFVFRTHTILNIPRLCRMHMGTMQMGVLSTRRLRAAWSVALLKRNGFQNGKT